jgi:hypothetical protein
LQVCWIDVYQDLPDIIVSDAGKNFASKKFWQHAVTININIKKILVEAYNSVSKIEQYYDLLQ